MVALNFTVFQDKILAGTKRQTIRRRARCKPGDRLQIYTGMRTKACRKLGEAVCTRVETVLIPAPPLSAILLDQRRWLRGEAARGFAAADGFDSLEAFFAFFRLQ
ncbi:MAG: ASCH domain-containing protein [Acidobacteria bacterium]|nr:ASCH domain-containing protein [Acidobacteriota bacterium]